MVARGCERGSVTHTIRATHPDKPGHVRELPNIASHAQAELVAASWWRQGYRQITINGEPWQP